VATDGADQGVGMDFIFFNANTSLGTERYVPNISASSVLTAIGGAKIVSTDWYDLGTPRIAYIPNIGMMMKSGGATTSLYIAGIARGTGTFTGSAIQLQLSFMRN
jgi:hypothetical protein